MRNRLIISLLAISALIATVSFTPVGVNVASVATASRDRITNTCLESLQTAHAGISEEVTDIQKVDINDDGVHDRVVKLTNEDSCGNSGCITEICLAHDGSAQLLPFGYATKEFRVLETRSDGYYDITINDSVTLSWDGTHYTPTE